MHFVKGFSFFGFLFVAVVLAAVSLIGFKVAPAYTEYFAIKRVLNATAVDSVGLDPQRIRLNFDRRVLADYIEAVHGVDLDIAKDGGQIVLSVSYVKKIPLVANASLVLDFEAEARR